MDHYQQVEKRAIDVIISILMLTFLAPFMLGIGLLIRWKMGSPVFFRQERTGWRGVPFTFYKFRTMINKNTVNGKEIPDEKRLTALGTFLRCWSLDELPQIWNVLRGDMSLVGPRPLLVEYLDLYSPEQARRHDIKPGITGWAQINGRNAITWENKFELDVWYVDHCNVLLDIRIMLMTLWKAFRRDGISAASHVIMPKFMGHKKQDKCLSRGTIYRETSERVHRFLEK
jgi:sugar transferase EpsL